MRSGFVMLSALLAACCCCASASRSSALVGGSSGERICRRHLKSAVRKSGLAFVFGGVGPLAAGTGWRRYYMPRNYFKCLAAVESLVKVAGWAGDTYLLTNRGNPCFDQERISDLVEGIPGVRVLKILDDDDPLTTSTAGGGLKVDMFKYLPEHVETVVWHDCDVVFARPDCLREMLADPPKFNSTHRFYYGADSDKIPPGRRTPMNVHVGAFIAHRKWSKPVLDAWRAELKPQKIDYECLISAFAHHPEVERVSHAAPRRWLDHFFNREPVHTSSLMGLPWDRSPHVRKGEGCVNHITGMRCRTPEVGPKIAPFLGSLCLSTFGPLKGNASEGARTSDWCEAHRDPARLLRACLGKEPSRKVMRDAGAMK
eukprot:Hpha_TRINITY_DN9176_c0_g1::TRINITY_DN9176_c0_g1_i1::g.94601::m.94601